MSAYLDLLNELKQRQKEFYVLALLMPKQHQVPFLLAVASYEFFAEIPKLAKEPMLVQMRFAWWHEAIVTLETDAASSNKAHPLLLALKQALEEGTIDADFLSQIG